MMISTLKNTNAAPIQEKKKKKEIKAKIYVWAFFFDLVEKVWIQINQIKRKKIRIC